MRFLRHHKLLASLVLFCLLAVASAYIFLPDPLFKSSNSTVVLAQDGSLLSKRIASNGRWCFPEQDSVSHMFETCILTYEDSRFRWHFGIDPIAIARAAIADLGQHRFAQGGSTITMQLARMARGNQHRTIGQKIIECMWAVGIEIKYSKDEILNLYASHAPMGGNTEGVDAAAWRYFGKDASQLSCAENAMLAVLPNSPALIHISRNRDKLLQKRNALLVKLKEKGFIDDETCSLALEEPLPDKPAPLNERARQLTETLIRTRGTGRTWHTTIDAALQNSVSKIADNYSLRYRGNRIENIAILVADVSSGEAKAYVGNTELPSEALYVDMAQAERSTGSALKPFLYAAMLSQGEIAPKSIFADIPLSIKGFSPQNFNKTFSGAVAADEALRQSLNVPLVRMLTLHGTGRFMQDLKALGMNSLHFSEDHYGASLILGGAEATLWNLCGMYASMARRLSLYNQNDSRYADGDIHPLRILRPTNDDNGLIGSTTTNVFSEKLPSASAIWYTFETMSNLNRPEEEAQWQQFSSMKKVAWKTGTSYGNRDAWAIGVTPDYVVGVWVGNASGEGRSGLTGVGFAAPVLFDVFGMLPGNKWFAMPLEDTDPIAVCSKSGMRATDACQHADTMLLPRKCIDTETCRFCQLVHLSQDGHWRVNSSCAKTSEIQIVSWFILPPAMEYYFMSRHSDYYPLPPMRPDCTIEGTKQIEFISPENHSTIIRPRNFNGVKESVVCRVASRRRSATIFWHLDNHFIGTTNGLHEMTIEPANGKHVLTAVDEDGNSDKVFFTVE